MTKDKCLYTCSGVNAVNADMYSAIGYVNVWFTSVQGDISTKEVTISSTTGNYNPTSLVSVTNVGILCM